MSLKSQRSISSENEAFRRRQEEFLRREQEMRDAELANARSNNLSQQQGKWDPTTQTFWPGNGVSGQGNSWDRAVAFQQEKQRIKPLAEAYGAQTSVNDEMGEIMARSKREQAAKQLDVQNTLAAAMKYSENGFLPEELRGYINRRYGWDGETSGVLQGSGMQKDGNYVFNVVGADQNGNPTQQNVVFSPVQRFQMAQAERGIYSDQDRAIMRSDLLRSGMSEKEVSSMEFDPFAGSINRIVSNEVDAMTNEGARQRMAETSRQMAAAPSGGNAVASVNVPGNVARALFGRGGDNRSRVSFFASDGRGGGMRSEYNGHTGERSEEMLGNWSQYEKDRDAERLAKVAYAKNGGRMDIEQMKDKTKRDLSAAEIEAKERRQGSWLDDKRSGRLVNIYRDRIRALNEAKNKETDENKKADIQKQIDEANADVEAIVANTFTPNQGGGAGTGQNAAAGTPDAVLGRQPVLGQKSTGVTGANGTQSATVVSGVRTGEIDVTDKSVADKAKADGGTYRVVNENDGTHYYVTPAKKVRPNPSNGSGNELNGKKDISSKTGVKQSVQGEENVEVSEDSESFYDKEMMRLDDEQTKEEARIKSEVDAESKELGWGGSKRGKSWAEKELKRRLGNLKTAYDNKRHQLTMRFGADD